MLFEFNAQKVSWIKSGFYYEVNSAGETAHIESSYECVILDT